LRKETQLLETEMEVTKNVVGMKIWERAVFLRKWNNIETQMDQRQNQRSKGPPTK